MKPLVLLENVSVRYRLPGQRVSTIKEFTIRSILGRMRYEEFWALRGVSLQVRPEEFVGIVGRNGAGKSTLLKILAGVMKPTEGSVRLDGKVAPLIELGTGFDMELTGRENIYLNGSIFGYTRREMAAKFDGIVGFSELGQFIEAPLRTYSSGMVARLAFAIATDVDPKILLLDEILEVGDESFRHKCRDRMAAFRARGVAILFVSHDLSQVRSWCSRALWIDGGRINASGEVDRVVDEYERFLQIQPN